MSRVAVIVAALAMMAGCCTSGSGCCAEKKDGCCCFPKEFGVQLYSVRELLGDSTKYAANHETVLKQLADMGYTSVEAANYKEGKFYGVTPEQFKSDVEAAGLKVLSSHTGRWLAADELESGDFSAAWDWWDQCIAAHKAAGMTYIIVPWSKKPETKAHLQVYCDYLNAIGKRCADAGLKFGYHSHSHEFQKVEDVVMLDYMLENTDPSLVFFEMDVFWAVWGKVSPVAYFKKYPGRFTCLHIKDLYEVGQSGMVGFDAIFRNAGTAGARDFIVEMEGSGVGDIMETCRVSIDYLLRK